MMTFLSRVWKQEGGPEDRQPDYAEIIFRARGNMRDAIMQIEVDLMCPPEPKMEADESSPVLVEVPRVRQVVTLADIGRRASLNQ